MAHEANPSCSSELLCGFLILFLCVAVSLIARVAVRFVTSSSLEVVTRLTTNGGRDVLPYHVCMWLGDVMHYKDCISVHHVCMVICCLQTVCGVTEKHGYSLAGYHKLYQL